MKKIMAIAMIMLALACATTSSVEAAKTYVPQQQSESSTKAKTKKFHIETSAERRTQTEGRVIEPVATYNAATLDSRAEMAKIGQMRDIRATVLVVDPVSGWCWQYEVPAIDDGVQLGKTFFMEGFVVVAIGDKARATVLHGCRRIGEVLKERGQSGWHYQLDKMDTNDISKRLIEAVSQFVSESDRGEGLFWFEASRVFEVQATVRTSTRTSTPIQPRNEERTTTNQIQDGLATVNDFLRLIK